MAEDIEKLRKDFLKDDEFQKILDGRVRLKWFLILSGLACFLLVAVLLIVMNTMQGYKNQQKLQYQELYNMRKTTFRKERKSYATSIFSKCALKSSRKWKEVELAETADLFYETGELHYGIPMEEWIILVRAESHFDKHAEGDAGEIGIMQTMPLTARYMASVLGLNYRGSDSLKNPLVSAKLGMRYYSDLKEEYKKPIIYISAYCWGPRHGGAWNRGRKMSDKNLEYIRKWDKAREWVEKTLECAIDIDGLVIPE